MGRVEGKVIIVTGGGRGLGEAMVRLLAAEGGRVVVTDIDPVASALADELGETVHFMRHDVRSRDDWVGIVAETEKAFGPVNVLVNNAGLPSTPGSGVETLSEESYRHLIDVNQIGVFLGMQVVAQSMKKAGGGSIINMSSVSGLVGKPQTSAYTASKFAVRGMTKVAAVELGVHKIRVNSIHPGPMDTAMVRDAEGALRPTVQRILETLPAGRLGQPMEVAHMVLLLASDDMRFATGAEFVIDGGATCG